VRSEQRCRLHEPDQHEVHELGPEERVEQLPLVTAALGDETEGAFENYCLPDWLAQSRHRQHAPATHLDSQLHLGDPHLPDDLAVIESDEEGQLQPQKKRRTS